MKKLFIPIVIILAVGLFFYLKFKNNSQSGAVQPGTTTNNTFHPDPSAATFQFDDETVTLSQGQAETSGTDTTDETALLTMRAYGDLNADNKDDAVVFLTRSGGGSGVFVYVAAYVSGPINYKGSNAIFLGDRVTPQSMVFNKGIVTVKYLDRGPDEPFAAEPTIPVSKQFVYKNGTFEER